MGVVHLVTTERFPFTLCGVDINVKTGADWTDPEDMESLGTEVTCRNCQKLMNGGQMGAPPPRPEKKVVDPVEEREGELRSRMATLEGYNLKMASLLTGVSLLIGGAIAEKEINELVFLQEYLEAAASHLGFALDEVRYVLSDLQKGIVSDET